VRPALPKSSTATSSESGPLEFRCPWYITDASAKSAFLADARQLSVHSPRLLLAALEEPVNAATGASFASARESLPTQKGTSTSPALRSPPPLAV
jgi:hypothetical protein